MNNLPPQLIRIWKALGGDEYAMLAGGAVRDILRGEEPKDYDLACVLSPKNAVHHVTYAEADAMFYMTGVDHGTITVVLDGFSCEVTTLRKDVTTDGRHAEVEFTRSFEEDAKRRDFTMNGLFMKMDGTVVDFVGGVKAIEEQIINYIGDPKTRIIEDHLRIMRLFRFASTLGWEVARESLEVSYQEAYRIHSVSKERVWSELKKLLGGINWQSTIERMRKNGTLRNIIVRSTYRCNPDNILSRFYLVASRDDLKDVFAMSNDEDRYLKSIKDAVHENRHREMNDSELNQLVFKYGKEIASEVIIMHEVVSGKDYLLDYVHKLEVPQFPVRGEDLMAFGYSGRELGDELRRLTIEWVESSFKMTREELLEDYQNEI